MRPLDLNDPQDFEKAKRALPVLKRALPYTRGAYNIAEIGEGILTGEMQLWCHKHSAVVTEIEVYKTKKICTIFLAAGFLDEVMTIRPEIEKWAVEMGCSESMIIGRRGWLRTLKGSGYKESAVVLHKELTHVEEG